MRQTSRNSLVPRPSFHGARSSIIATASRSRRAPTLASLASIRCAPAVATVICGGRDQRKPANTGETADADPPCFRGFSHVFAGLRKTLTNRGARIRTGDLANPNRERFPLSARRNACKQAVLFVVGWADGTSGFGAIQGALGTGFGLLPKLGEPYPVRPGQTTFAGLEECCRGPLSPRSHPLAVAMGRRAATFS
jgi:hypothetical protein